MSRLQQLCETCSNVAVLSESLPLYDSCEFVAPKTEWSHLNRLECGHVFHITHSPSVELTQTTFRSLNGEKTARHYQAEGLEFAVRTNFNCLIADQQGLGKTIEALLAIREYEAQLVPALIIVKSATIWQWQREIKEWCNALPNGVWMIRDGKGFIPPGFKIYLISMDTLRSYVKPTGEKVTQKLSKKFKSTTKQEYIVSDSIVRLGLKCVIADEVHSFKNTESRRSNALVELIRTLGIEHKIFLSGTPIKNRASEYFVPLNLLDPLNFPAMENFKIRYLSDDGKRIDPYSVDAFKAITDNYIIRRERNQVLTDLPPFQRVFSDVCIESENLKKLYNIELEKMREKQNDSNSGQVSYNDVKDNLMKMRRIIGQAKAEMIVDTIIDFLESSEDEKLVIGVHHVAVRDYLAIALEEYRPLTLSGEDSADRKAKLIEVFQRPNRRIMIVNIIAGGTGLNLQFCNNCIVLERQWNAADEEQFEDRFNRIGQTLPVTAAYPKAKGTIDEFFSDMVEEKRGIFGETVAIDFESWMSQGGVNDLVDWACANKL